MTNNNTYGDQFKGKLGALLSPETVEAGTLNEVKSTTPSAASISISSNEPEETVLGLDIFAQIAANANPLPVIPKTERRPSQEQEETISAERYAQLQKDIMEFRRVYQQQQLLQQQKLAIKINKEEVKVEEEEDEEDDSYSDEDEDSEEESEDDDDLRPMSGRKRRINSYDPSPSNLQTTINIAPKRSSLTETSITVKPATSARSSNRRTIHNICERKRRENIREGFAALQHRLPTNDGPTDKLSKMEILKRGYDHIRALRVRVSTIDDQIKMLTAVYEKLKSHA